MEERHSQDKIMLLLTTFQFLSSTEKLIYMYLYFPCLRKIITILRKALGADLWLAFRHIF